MILSIHNTQSAIECRMNTDLTVWVSLQPPVDGPGAIWEAVYADPDFIYDQDDEDPDFDPSMPNCDTDTKDPIADAHNIKGHHAKYETKCPKALTDQIWRNKLQEMSAEELGSPKKLITASASVRFLYILGEYLSRLLPALTTVYFDGRTTSVDDWMEIANRFNSEGGDIDLPELP